jgi:hypothetical protein
MISGWNVINFEAIINISLEGGAIDNIMFLEHLVFVLGQYFANIMSNFPNSCIYVTINANAS